MANMIITFTVAINNTTQVFVRRTIYHNIKILQISQELLLKLEKKYIYTKIDPSILKARLEWYPHATTSSFVFCLISASLVAKDRRGWDIRQLHSKLNAVKIAREMMMLSRNCDIVRGKRYKKETRKRKSKERKKERHWNQYLRGGWKERKRVKEIDR